MHDDAKSSGPGSGTTSATSPETQNLSEAEFLTRQSEDAKVAIDAKWRQLRDSLKQTGDVQAWAREYPWSSVTLAAVAGFLVASALAPRRPRSGGDNSLLERVLADEEISRRLKELAEADATQRPGLMQSLASSLLKNFGGALQTAILAAVSARMAEPTTNGHDPAAAEAGTDPMDGA